MHFFVEIVVIVFVLASRGLAEDTVACVPFGGDESCTKLREDCSGGGKCRLVTRYTFSLNTTSGCPGFIGIPCAKFDLSTNSFLSVSNHWYTTAASSDSTAECKQCGEVLDDSYTAECIDGTCVKAKSGEKITCNPTEDQSTACEKERLMCNSKSDQCTFVTLEDYVTGNAEWCGLPCGEWDLAGPLYFSVSRKWKDSAIPKAMLECHANKTCGCPGCRAGSKELGWTAICDDKTNRCVKKYINPESTARPLGMKNTGAMTSGVVLVTLEVILATAMLAVTFVLCLRKDQLNASVLKVLLVVALFLMVSFLLMQLVISAMIAFDSKYEAHQWYSYNHSEEPSSYSGAVWLFVFSLLTVIGMIFCATLGWKLRSSPYKYSVVFLLCAQFILALTGVGVIIDITGRERSVLRDQDELFEASSWMIALCFLGGSLIICLAVPCAITSSGISLAVKAVKVGKVGKRTGAQRTNR